MEVLAEVNLMHAGYWQCSTQSSQKRYVSGSVEQYGTSTLHHEAGIVGEVVMFLISHRQTSPIDMIRLVLFCHIFDIRAQAVLEAEQNSACNILWRTEIMGICVHKTVHVAPASYVYADSEGACSIAISPSILGDYNVSRTTDRYPNERLDI